jgi:hypothetical protein
MAAGGGRNGSDAPRAQTKGVGFINVRAFVTERFGAAAWNEVLRHLDDTDRETLEAVVSVGWYDLALYARMIRIVDDKLGDGDLKLVHALGRFEAERDLTTIHQWFLRLIRPSIAIEQTGKYWRRFHDTGEWFIQRRGDREVLGTLIGWGVVDTALCRELVAYLARTLELLGGQDVAMDHPRCRARGDDACEFRLRWRMKKDAPHERQPPPPDPGPAPLRTRAGTFEKRK